MIIAAAIKFFPMCGKYPSHWPMIWTGLRHAQILEDIFQMGIIYDRDSCIQGFLTDDNHFLDRYKAREYAIDCGQVVPKDILYKELYSENLWPEEGEEE